MLVHLVQGAHANEGAAPEAMRPISAEPRPRPWVPERAW